MFQLIKTVLRGVIYFIVFGLAGYGGYKLFYDNLDVCVLLEAKRRMELKKTDGSADSQTETVSEEVPVEAPVVSEPLQDEAMPPVEVETPIVEEPVMEEISPVNEEALPVEDVNVTPAVEDVPSEPIVVEPSFEPEQPTESYTEEVIHEDPVVNDILMDMNENSAEEFPAESEIVPLVDQPISEDSSNVYEPTQETFVPMVQDEPYPDLSQEPVSIDDNESEALDYQDSPFEF